MEIYRMMAGIYAANCFLIYNDEKNAFIVDPGGDSDDIMSTVEKLELVPKFILLTHGHGDHIGAAEILRGKYSIPILAHENEVKLLQDANINMSAYMPIKRVELTPDKTFKDGDIIGDGFGIKVIHTPGHTSGSCCFLMGDDLITGDTVFRGSIGRTDLETGNYDEIIESIKNKILVLDDKVKIYPGHGPITSMEIEKVSNPYFADLLV
ncbi:MBL fold metallo-hydrolase [Microaceticoccus formicicus]|uniref:MBL fold metallo-hydrolase n=1 Tax=Microaceticoccus formicicus TaxID=3118105 RepID=UPI003CD04B28|nr:MBL fold metallo-hydrolase [Peptoniphilaceae bacterium AMB_02]